MIIKMNMKFLLIIGLVLVLKFNYEFVSANNPCIFDGCKCKQSSSEITVICQNPDKNNTVGFPNRNQTYLTSSPIFALYIENYTFKT
jgi:hypothetical protein